MATQTSFVTKLSIFGIIAMGLVGAWKGLNQVPLKIADLPIKGTKTVVQSQIEQPAKPDALKTLAPLLVPKQPSNAGSVLSENSGEFKQLMNKAFIVDTALSKQLAKDLPELPKDIAPVVDGFDSLKSTLRVTALMEQGAVINNKYYHKGESLSNVTYVNASMQLVSPILIEVTENTVILQEPKSKRKVQLSLR